LALDPGTRLGAYEILSLLGSGGMGEIYRGRDTRLDRVVAIKILPDAVAADPQFRERFAREARALSQLAHPHICTLFDIGHQDGVDFLVLELLDGETLADRLERFQHRGLPLADALLIATQIADALASAHRSGIVHRDLKPGNVMLTKSGAKLLDFGLAKAAPVLKSSTDATRGAPALTAPPTKTTPLTVAGSIIGTFQYMAPEQLEGGEADVRSDLFAFGAVLYEMLTGRKAFAGKSQVSVMAAILDHDPPPASSVQPAVPDALERLVAQCLAKAPDARWQNARDVQNELVWIADTLAQSPRAIASSPSNTRRDAAVAAIAAAATAFAVGMTWWLVRPVPRQVPTVHVNAELGVDGALAGAGGAGLAISPDGSLLAFVAQRKQGRPQLYVRRLQQLLATPLAGTEDAAAPFFSPDGQWIGFFAGEKLKKVSVTGGATVTIADAPTGRGGWWADDDTIVFEPLREGAPLVRITASGGQPAAIGTLADGEVTQRWPQVLPGGKAVLFTSSRSPSGFTEANLVVQTLSGGSRRILQRGGSYGRYLLSGHLTYIRQGTLFAAPFNADRLELTGQPVPIVENVVGNAGSGAAQFAVSDNGTLVYVAGQGTGGGAPIYWMDRQGRLTPLRSTPAPWGNIRFSPDGTHLAVEALAADGTADV
jgi:serine/threonine-protein kinase